MEKRFAVIIPARYGSTRFPGKPLAMINGKMMVERVYEQAAKAASLVWVATDDKRIYEAVWGFGGKAVMTATGHRSGTDRCEEAVERIRETGGAEIDVVINVQGDEPFIMPEQIALLKKCFAGGDVTIATLIRPVEPGESIENPNRVKVVVSSQLNALYFSRLPVPFLRDVPREEWTKRHLYYKHIGMYGYTVEALKEITQLPAGKLEIAESLEQNRWLEYGHKIRCAITHHESAGIDTPEDLKKIL